MTALFAICDDQWALVKTASSPIGLKASTGKQFGDATQWTVEELRANFVLVIDQGVIPDQEWQTVIGNPTVVIDGDPNIPETMAATLQYTTQPISLDAAKAKLKEKVKHCKFTRMDAGIEFEVGGETYLVQTDAASRSLIDSTFALAVNGYLPDGRGWRMGDNSYPMLSQQELIDMSLAVGAMVGACYDVQSTLEAAIDALPDLEACMAFDCSTEFPLPPTIEPA